MSPLEDAYRRLEVEVGGPDVLPSDCTQEELVVASFKVLLEEIGSLRRDVAHLRDELRRELDRKGRR